MPPNGAPAQKMIGDFAPQACSADRRGAVRRRLGASGPVRARPQPDHRRRPGRAVPDRQLGSHLRRSLANGLSRDDLVEAITHLAFYAGRPKPAARTALAGETRSWRGQHAQGNPVPSPRAPYAHANVCAC